MSQKITSTSNELMSRALGIPDRRYEEITNTIADVMAQHEDIRYSEIAEQVSQRLNLSTNEIFFLGVALGGYAQFRFMVDGMIQSVEEVSNIPTEIHGRPVARPSTMAMA
jgi:branched-subunit amino acid ABC-type transport system permease component